MEGETHEIRNSKELGKLLKNMREQKGIELEAIQRDTKIRIKYLRAIEEGEFSAIPGGNVYIKGFLSSYAKAIGLPPSDILRYYKKITEIENNERSTVNDSEHDIELKNEFQTRKNLKLIGITVVVIVFLALLFFGIFYAIKSFQKQPISYSNPKIQEQSHKPVQNINPQSTEETSQESKYYNDNDTDKVVVEVTEDTSNNTTYTVQDKSINVVIQTIQGRCWISVKKDGIRDYEGILTHGDMKNWTANDELIIRVGNPQVIKLKVNGRDFGIIGGRTRNLIFKRRE